MALTILHTNDLHGSLHGPPLERLIELRKHADLLIDSGDCIKAGNLAVPLSEDPAWQALHDAGCNVGTIGNRESHPLAAAFQAKLRGFKHELLCANLKRKDGSAPLPSSWTLDIQTLDGDTIRVGAFGVMVPMVTERMVSQSLSAFIWTNPIEAAQALANELRPVCDCLIAITHIGIRADRELAAACPSLDLILGGHSHNTLDSPERIGRVAICQGGSHARFVGRYRWSPMSGLEGAELLPLQ